MKKVNTVLFALLALFGVSSQVQAHIFTFINDYEVIGKQEIQTQKYVDEETGEILTRKVLVQKYDAQPIDIEVWGAAAGKMWTRQGTQTLRLAPGERNDTAYNYPAFHPEVRDGSGRVVVSGWSWAGICLEKIVANIPGKGWREIPIRFVTEESFNGLTSGIAAVVGGSVALAGQITETAVSATATGDPSALSNLQEGADAVAPSGSNLEGVGSGISGMAGSVTQVLGGIFDILKYSSCKDRTFIITRDRETGEVIAITYNR